MAIPTSLQHGLTLPVIAAPMFLVSGPDLVVETCNAGVIVDRSAAFKGTRCIPGVPHRPRIEGGGRGRAG